MSPSCNHPLPAWIDAHNHLQDPLLSCLAEDVSSRAAPGSLSLVNGTSPQDWPLVADAAMNSPDGIVPAFGVHPWKTADCARQWLPQLDTWLNQPNASLGEVGLDRWIANANIPLQVRILQQQLELVEQRPCTISFHCLKAWPEFHRIAGSWLREHPRPFLLHAYGGPPTDVAHWLDLGGYFSFSPYFLYTRKQVIREIFQQIPLERLLVETDAPAMAPPTMNGFHVPLSKEGQRINVPANIIPTYQALADLRDMPIQELQRQIQQNFSDFYWR